jgi:hypothetical protein
MASVTFLQFVCEKLLGPPAKNGGQEGEFYWRCPFHDDTRPSFHTLPVKEDTKDYWKCFGCGLWGDELNLLRDLRDIGHPDAQGDHDDHQALLRQWRAEYDAAVAAGQLNGLNGEKKGMLQANGATPTGATPPLFSSVETVELPARRGRGVGVADAGGERGPQRGVRGGGAAGRASNRTGRLPHVPSVDAAPDVRPGDLSRGGHEHERA